MGEPAETAEVEEPWAGYSDQNASDIIAQVKSMDADKLGPVRGFEEANEGRSTILKAIDTAEAVPPEGEPEAYTAEQLVADSRSLLGQPSHVVVGALHGLPDGDTLTVAQGKAQVREFLKRRVGE